MYNSSPGGVGNGAVRNTAVVVVPVFAAAAAADLELLVDATSVTDDGSTTLTSGLATTTVSTRAACAFS